MKSTMRRGYFLPTASKHQGQKKARCFWAKNHSPTLATMQWLKNIVPLEITVHPYSVIKKALRVLKPRKSFNIFVSNIQIKQRIDKFRVHIQDIRRTIRCNAYPRTIVSRQNRNTCGNQSFIVAFSEALESKPLKYLGWFLCFRIKTIFNIVIRKNRTL